MQAMHSRQRDWRATVSTENPPPKAPWREWTLEGYDQGEGYRGPLISTGEVRVIEHAALAEAEFERAQWAYKAGIADGERMKAEHQRDVHWRNYQAMELKRNEFQDRALKAEARIVELERVPSAIEMRKLTHERDALTAENARITDNERELTALLEITRARCDERDAESLAHLALIDGQAGEIQRLTQALEQIADYTDGTHDAECVMRIAREALKR